MKRLRGLTATAIGLFASVHALAAPHYSIKVIYPDKEEKTYALNGEDTAIPMRKSKWKCAVSNPEKLKGDDGLYRSDIVCNLNGSKEFLMLPLSCQDDGRWGTSTIHLSDRNGDHMLIQLSCNKP